jgi:ComEC/Rec2-related protein
MSVLVIPVLMIYTVLIGMPLPAMRALLAAAFILVARGWGASVHREDLFGLSLIVMMIFIPDLPRSVSMDLSVMAVLGVLAALRKEAGSTKKDVPDMSPLATVKTGLWVTLFTTPLLWGVFNIGDLVGIFSNPVIVPLAGEFLLLAGFAYLGLEIFFGWSSSVLELFLKACSQAVIGLATFFSGIRLGQISLPPVPPLILLVSNGWLLGLFLRKNHSRSLGTDVFPLLIIMAPIFFLSVSDHLLYNRGFSGVSGGRSDVMPALVHYSGPGPVAAGEQIVLFPGWLWRPQVEVRNLSRLVHVPSSVAPGR